MKRLLRRYLTAAIATLLVGAATPVGVAQSSLSSSSSPNSITQSEEHLSADSGPESGFSEREYPAFPKGEEPPQAEVVESELDPEELSDWQPTADPNSAIVPGQMRSDREEIPGDFTKEQADLAEIKEAQLQAVDSPTLNAAPGCGVYWPSPFEVCGAIKERYDALGGPRSFLTLPKSNEVTNPDGVGKRSEFVNGFIYRHPRTGAHPVSIPATVVWARHGWEQGHFGYPTEGDTHQGNQWYKQQYEGGYIYTHNALPPVQSSIQGAIYDKWVELGAQNSNLGYPISDEIVAPDGQGRYNLFEGGTLLWHPAHGAHAVTGDILLQWVYSGGPEGDMGYPAGSPVMQEDGWYKQTFATGNLYGQRLNEIFPPWDEGAGNDSPTLQSASPAGGNAHTDQVVLETQDKCGNNVVLRRGWYTPGAPRKGPWGFDKIYHKHGIYSLYSLKTVIENSCQDRMEGTQRIYEEYVYRQECNTWLLVCRPTGESFQIRGVYEPNVYISGATEPRGLITMFPVHKTGTHGVSDVAPRWFSAELPGGALGP